MTVNGYPDSLIAIDDQMVPLGRPVPPVVSWLSGGFKGDFNAATAQWRERVLAWERDRPDDAARWYELREQYIAEEERLESFKWNEDEFHYRTLLVQKAPEACVDTIRRKFDDSASIRAARDWAHSANQWALVLCGGVGCGKTTAAAWAAHQLMMRKHRLRWIRCAAMVDAPMWGGEAEIAKFRAKEAGVLVLDDIAATARETRQDQALPWKAWLRDVLDSRWGAKRKTIITSNLAAGALAEWLGDALADRLNEGTVHTSTEKSRRQAKARAA